MAHASSSRPKTRTAQRLLVDVDEDVDREETDDDESDSDLQCRDITADVSVGQQLAIQGGMALIYQGRWKPPGADGLQKVAIKAVRFSAAPPEKTRRRLLREIRVWSSLDHPHVLTMCGIYRGLGDAEYPAMVAPWCENGSILRYLDGQRSSEHIQALLDKGIREILLGLQYLHGKNIVHGDLKSANILASEVGEALLCDFGLATVLAEDATPQQFSSVVKGTCRWMAPELFDSDDARHTKASDIWALGCVVLELTTGRWPYFQERTDQEVILALSNGQKPQRTRPDSISRDTWQRMLHCWVLDPEQRPTVETLLQVWEPHHRELPQWWTRPPRWILPRRAQNEYRISLLVDVEGLPLEEAFACLHDGEACRQLLSWSRMC